MFLSIFVGSALGILYGLSFFTSKKKALSHAIRTPSLIRLAAIGLARLGAFALIFYFLLLQPFLNYILVLVSFLITLWIVIIRKSDVHLWKV